MKDDNLPNDKKNLAYGRSFFCANPFCLPSEVNGYGVPTALEMVLLEWVLSGMNTISKAAADAFPPPTHSLLVAESTRDEISCEPTRFIKKRPKAFELNCTPSSRQWK